MPTKQVTKATTVAKPAAPKQTVKTVEARCENCKFWDITKFGTDANAGGCRRYPKPLPTQYNDWCGEYKKR